ncbi:MAG: hypothetical protein ABEJ40_09425 [Haloarculaceae archaeon]
MAPERPGTEDESVAAVGPERRLHLPDDADADEAAAIATAVGAHVSDRAVTAEVAGDEPDAEPVDPWKLAGRTGSTGRRPWSGPVRPGDEWKAAGRTFD